MSAILSAETRLALFDYIVSAGDDLLILGHRLSELCGHAPLLEEDIALSNIALDCLGQATLLLNLAGQVEGKGRDADRLAYFRDSVQFRNCLLVEQLNGHFGVTILRQFLYSSFAFSLWNHLAETDGIYPELAAIAQKARKETAYHVRHSAEWVIRLGQGTDESQQRMTEALELLWPLSAEMFVPTPGEDELTQDGLVISRQSLVTAWLSSVTSVFDQAGLKRSDMPNFSEKHSGRHCYHSEHLGHVLAELQILPRSYPNAQW